MLVICFTFALLAGPPGLSFFGLTKLFTGSALIELFTFDDCTMGAFFAVSVAFPCFPFAIWKPDIGGLESLWVMGVCGLDSGVGVSISSISSAYMNDCAFFLDSPVMLLGGSLPFAVENAPCFVGDWKV